MVKEQANPAGRCRRAVPAVAPGRVLQVGAESDALFAQYPWLGPTSALGASPREVMAVSQWAVAAVSL